MRKATALKATAYHEAGHAVIGRALGLVCGHVTIVQDGDSSGHALIDDPYAIQYQWECRGKFRDLGSVFRGRIIALQAGAEAEREFGFTPKGDFHDKAEIARMLDVRWLPEPDGTDRYEARLRSRARGLVRRHKAKIERVALALLKQGTLSPDEVEDLTTKGQKGQQ